MAQQWTECKRRKNPQSRTNTELGSHKIIIIPKYPSLDESLQIENLAIIGMQRVQSSFWLKEKKLPLR